MNPLFNRPPVFCLTLGLLALILLAQPTVASPINAPQVPNVAIVEDGWTLIRTVSAANPMAAHYNPLDGLLYYARRPGSGGSLNRINADGTLTQIVTQPMATSSSRKTTAATSIAAPSAARRAARG